MMTTIVTSRLTLPRALCILLLTWSTGGLAGKTPENIPGVTKVTAEELINMIQEQTGLTVIDARMDDRQRGYIEGSISLPDVNTDCDTLDTVIPTKSTPAVFYCNGVKCGRSAKSVRIALNCGYKTIYWYRGGFEDWLNNDYPYVVN
jgi:rhodanese-related sulfurtransferase